MLKEADPSNEILVLKSYEAMEQIANGTATKLIIPSDMQGMAGMAASLAEIWKDGVKPDVKTVQKPKEQ